MGGPVLSPSEAAVALAQPSDQAARRLLGAYLRGPDGVVVTIVEVEAYGGPGTDPASHTYRGQTDRNQAMFGQPGSLYVYQSYGIHTCLNVVSHEPGSAGGVLIRAGRVQTSVDDARRGRDYLSEVKLASGPGRLGTTLGYHLSDGGLELLKSGLLRLSRLPVNDVEVGPRVGVSKAVERPWRFWIQGAAEVTRYRAGGTRSHNSQSKDRQGRV